MPKSRVLAILSLVALSFVLVACGNEDDPQPTAESTAIEMTIVSTESVVIDAVANQDVPTVVAASPVIVTVFDPSAATPEGEAIATPAGGVIASGPAMPVTTTFEFSGAAQRDYLITDEGCVGLGEWSQLKPGAQVVVRDASGSVVDIATLAANGDTNSCRWIAEVSVPDSEFVSISIPMVTEVWFDQSELDAGTIQITIP